MLISTQCADSSEPSSAKESPYKIPVNVSTHSINNFCSSTLTVFLLVFNLFCDDIIIFCGTARISLVKLCNFFKSIFKGEHIVKGQCKTHRERVFPDHAAGHCKDVR